MAGEIVLAGGVRTPIGAFCGALSEVSAPQLGSVAVKAVLDRTGMPSEVIDEVIFGNVLSAGLGQNVARQVGIGAGLPYRAGAMTVNKVCGSGLKAVMLAAQAIACGDADIVIAGGTENMSQVPYLLTKARTGYRMGHGDIIDGMVHDGLWDVYNDIHMGMCGDRCASEYGFGREAQDDFAVASYERALAANEKGIFKEEIVPVEAPAGRKKTVLVSEDEEPQRFNAEKLRGLRPAFDKAGTVTAGNASSVNDGAAAILVTSEEIAHKRGIPVQARVLGYASHAHEPEWFTTAPTGAMKSLLKHCGLSAAQIDLYEINEAFAAVTMAAMKELDIAHEKVNIHGGAVALGHPIGASGARTLVTLLNAMKQRSANTGVVSLCIGGGEGVALAVELI